MDNQMTTTINLIKHDDEYFVSSKEVAERFGKRHRDVKRSILDLQVSDNFKERNFARCAETNANGVYSSIYYITKDGFMMLAMGFIGKEAMQWKEMFIIAFNKMEKLITDKIPILEAKVKQLEAEKSLLLLEGEKKPHHLKNTVMVPIQVDTLFGPEIEYRRVKKDNDHYSEMSKKEGKLKQLTQCSFGMMRSIDELTRELALLRRN